MLTPPVFTSLLFCLMRQQNAGSFLADIGCGSGLSCDEITHAGFRAWIGVDISPSMLRIAQGNLSHRSSSSSYGALALCDFSVGLPLRQIQGAISISALQWLCVGCVGNAHHSTEVFMKSLSCTLTDDHGGTAAFQVYFENDVQRNILQSSAHRHPFFHGYFVGFPHPTPARKYYYCLQKRNNGTAESVCLSGRACVLAWPHFGSCALQWLHHLELSSLPSHTHIVDRLKEEHSKMGRKMVRIYRRASLLDIGADSLSAATPTSLGGGGGGVALAEATIDDSERKYLQCGGCFACHITLPSHCAAASSTAFEQCASQLLLPGYRLKDDVTWKETAADIAALHNTLVVVEGYEAKERLHVKDTKKRYFYIEHIESPALDSCVQLGILSGEKIAKHFVLTLKHSSTRSVMEIHRIHTICQELNIDLTGVYARAVEEVCEGVKRLKIDGSSWLFYLHDTVVDRKFEVSHDITKLFSSSDWPL